MDAFLSHEWLGNMRELGNLIQRFVVLQNEDEILKELCSLAKGNPWAGKNRSK